MSNERHAVLVVTDIPANADTIMGLLEREHTLEILGSHGDIFDGIHESSPCLIILDAESPKIAVPDICSRLRADHMTSGIPVLLACPDESSAEAGILAGATDWVTKPFRPLAVQTRVRNCLNLSRCLDALRHFSLVDELTGIANRRRCEEFLNLEWRRNLRNQTPLSIVLMDLDLFTAYNDQYGSAAGDECLRRVASALTDLVQRPGDLIARYGRGGFACVLPETDTVGAVSVAERFRAEVFGLAISHDGSSVGPFLTASLGVATGVPLNGAEPEDLMTLAERHLFDAKRAGRNRVVFGS